MKRYLILTLLLFTAYCVQAQTSANAKSLMAAASKDSSAGTFEKAAQNMDAAMVEERKQAKPDFLFLANTSYRASGLWLKAKEYSKAHDDLYLSLSHFRKIANREMIGYILQDLSRLYDATRYKDVVYTFPSVDKEETFNVNLTIETIKTAGTPGVYRASLNAGSNDGVFAGASGNAVGKYIKAGDNRSNRVLGTAVVEQVFPNYAIVRIVLKSATDSAYAIYSNDMVSIPVRGPKIERSDIFSKITLLNIRFLDNNKKPIVHPRTVFRYNSKELETDIYNQLLFSVKEIYDMFKDEPEYQSTEKIKRGRFRGITWMEAMGKSSPDDLKAFLGFVRNYPGKYMGTEWKISETYATWLLNNAPPGSDEIMDSLIAAKSDAQIRLIAKTYEKDIKDVLFEYWLTDAQNAAIAGDLKTAYLYAPLISKVAEVFNEPDYLGWASFNWGRILEEDKKIDEALVSYQKAISYFEKGTDKTGLTFSLNNIASKYSDQYKYEEAQQVHEKALALRLKRLETDTSDEARYMVARSYDAIGGTFQKRSKYKEAILAYEKGVKVLEGATDLDCKKQRAYLFQHLGKSYEKMGEYAIAATFYEKELTAQKALGDIEAQGDALDNQGFLMSKLGNYRDAYQKYSLAYNYHTRSGKTDDAGFSMSNMGQVLWSLGSFDSAIAAHAKAIELRTKAGNNKGAAYSWKKMAALYKESGNAAKSMETYQKALDLYKQIDDKLSYSELLEDIASQYKLNKDYTKALSYYNEVLSNYRLMKDRNKEASTLSAIGDLYYEQQQYETASGFYNQTEKIQTDINDQTGLIYTYCSQAGVEQMLREDFKAALNKYKKALTMAVNTSSESNIAFAQQKIGLLYSFLNQYDSAKLYYDNSLAKYKALGDLENLAVMYNNFGYYYNYRGDFENAKQQFDSVYAIGTRIKNAYRIADGLYGLSGYYSTTGDFKMAMTKIEEVLKIYKEKENPWGIAAVYSDQANIKNDQGEYEEALNYYYKSDSIYNVLKLSKPRISLLNNIGTIYYFQHDYTQALKKFDQVKSMLDKNNDDPAFQALIKSNIGEVYVDLKKYDTAYKWLKESVDMAFAQKNNREVYISYTILGRLYSEKGEYEKATACFIAADSALKVGGEKKLQVQLLESWGRMLYKQKKFDDAKIKLSNSIELSNAIGYKKYAWKSLSTLADISFEENKNQQGLDYLGKSILEIEQIKSKLTGKDATKIFASDESIVELYQKMIFYLKKQGKVQEALVYMEKANAENINIRLKADEAKYDDAATAAAAAKEKELRKQQAFYDAAIAKEKSKADNLQHKEQLAQLEQMRSVAAEQYQAYVTDLKIKYPNLQAFKKVDPAQFMAEREDIPEDVAVVSYLVTDQELSVFVVSTDTIFVKDIPLDRNKLQAKIRRFYEVQAKSTKSSNDVRGGKVSAGANTVAPPAPGEKDALAAELYSVLIGPLMQDLKSKDRIAIVPSGFLCFVPFDALLASNDNGKKTYFGEMKQLFYVNKFSTITSGKSKPINTFKVLAVGNADKSLPQAEEEVKGLQSKMPQTVIYVREDATKKNVLGNKDGFNILHLATHGILDYANADNSYLVLAPDPTAKDDGKLTIAQIMSMTDINRFRLVTLSACETAVIREVAEGWPISTASAFIEMGVPTVIATLWQVDDKATRMLVDRFYENLKTMDKVKALQEAQIYLKNQPGYEDPYYWAPFQLLGLWK